MGQYLGLVTLGSQLKGSIVTRDTNKTPKDSTTAPRYRVYGPAGVMTNGTGSLSAKDSGTVTDASNATPIVITSAAHKLTTGTRVTIAGVTGNVAANGDWNITVIDANRFSLNGSAASGPYSSGGTWHVAGLYDVSLTPQGADGYVAGTNYTLFVTYVVGGITMADTHTFTVV